MSIFSTRQLVEGWLLECMFKRSRNKEERVKVILDELARKNDIRFAWQPGVVLPVSKSLRKQIFSYHLLRLRILAVDSGHIIASLFGRKHICHNRPPLSVGIVLLKLLFAYLGQRCFFAALHHTPDFWRNSENLCAFVIKEIPARNQGFYRIGDQICHHLVQSEIVS